MERERNIELILSVTVISNLMKKMLKINNRKSKLRNFISIYLFFYFITFIYLLIFLFIYSFIY